MARMMIIEFPTVQAIQMTPLPKRLWGWMLPLKRLLNESYSSL